MELRALQAKHVTLQEGLLDKKQSLASRFFYSSQDSFISKNSAVRFGNSVLDEELKPRLQQTTGKNDLIKAIRESGDKGSGRLVELLVPFVNTDDPDISFEATDAIIGMANRGEKEALETYVDLLLNYGTEAENDVKKEAVIRNLAVTSLMDNELLAQLEKQKLLDAAFARLREFNVPANLKNSNILLFQECLIRNHLRESGKLPAFDHFFKVSKIVENQFLQQDGSFNKLGVITAKALLGNKKAIEKLIEYMDTNIRSHRSHKLDMQSLGVTSDKVLRLFFDQALLQHIKDDQDLTIKFYDALEGGVSDNAIDSAYRLVLNAIIKKANMRGAFEKAVVTMRNSDSNNDAVIKHSLWLIQEINEQGLFNDEDKKAYLNNAKIVIDSINCPQEASEKFMRLDSLKESLYVQKLSDKNNVVFKYKGLEDGLSLYKEITEQIHKTDKNKTEDLDKLKKLQLDLAKEVLIQLELFMLRQQPYIFHKMESSLSFLQPYEAASLQTTVLDKIAEIGDDSNMDALVMSLKKQPLFTHADLQPYSDTVFKTIATIGKIAEKQSEDGFLENPRSIKLLVNIMNNYSPAVKNQINALIIEHLNIWLSLTHPGDEESCDTPEKIKSLNDEATYLKDVLQNNKPLDLKKVDTLGKVYNLALFIHPDIPGSLIDNVKQAAGKALCKLDPAEVKDIELRKILQDAQEKFKNLLTKKKSDQSKTS